MKETTMDIIGDIHKEELVELLKDLISIPSPTGKEKEIAQYISSYAKAMGFTSVHVSDQWDVVMRIDGKPQTPSLLLLTHTDHSNPSHRGTAYTPQVVGGRNFGKPGKVVTGEGSCAPKSSLAAMLTTGKMLAQKKDLRGSVVIAAVSRDLSANHDGVREVAKRGWIEADMAIVSEPSGNQPIIGARGINHILISIRGISTHWGRPEEGINPIWTIEHVLGVLRGVIDDLPSHTKLGRATLTPIDIQCEMLPPQTPGSCCLLLDRRTLPGEDGDMITKAIKKKMNKLKLEKQKFDVELVKQMYPFEGNADTFISKKVMEINQAITGKYLPFGYLPFSSNGGFLTHEMRIPTVIYGPGKIEDTIPSDHVEVESVLTATKVYAATAMEILQ